jgi:hypothetical protein
VRYVAVADLKSSVSSATAATLSGRAIRFTFPVKW